MRTFCYAMTFLLSCLVGGNSVDVLTFSNVTSTRILISWTRLLKELAESSVSGHVLNYTVRVRCLDLRCFREQVVAGNTAGSLFDWLTPDTTYMVQLRYMWSKGPMPLLPDGRLVTTLCQATPESVLQLLNTTIDPVKAYFELKFPSWTCSNKSVTLQRETSEGQWNSENVSISTDTLPVQVEVGDLLPCKTYRYRVQISANSGITKSNIVSFRTKGKEPCEYDTGNSKDANSELTSKRPTLLLLLVIVFVVIATAVIILVCVLQKENVPPPTIHVD